MNSSLRSLAFIAVVAFIPLAVSAQSTATSPTDPSGSNNAGANTGMGAANTNSGSNPSVYVPPPGDTANSKRNLSNHVAPGLAQSNTSTATALGVQSISPNDLDQQLTAKSITGKEVYDSQGNRVGKVRDVVLDYASAPQLANAFSKATDDQGASAGAGPAGQNGKMASNSSNTSASAGISGVGTSAGDNSMTATLYGAAAVISPDQSLGQGAGGNNLIAVPLMQLNYDSSKRHLTVNLSRDDLANLVRKNPARNAAE